MPSKKGLVVVGLSGGVDSSVAAALLRQQGYDLIGVFMKNWSGDACCTWETDLVDARRVAEVLGMPFYVWNFEREYYDKVMRQFFSEYASGRTPNPDIWCNQEIKFKVFLERALALGADFIATGHYAQISHDQDGYHLLRALDPAKEQSYFLCSLGQKELAKTLLPIGGYHKSVVRQLAAEFGLPTFAKKDSQGICFIGKIEVKQFLRDHLGLKAGEIVNRAGQVLGQHEGLHFYTIGQREGIAISLGGPYYVIAKDLSSNRLVVSNDPLDAELWRASCAVATPTWTNLPPEFPATVAVVIRYHHPSVPAVLSQVTDGWQLDFAEPQRAVTPGQAAVFYRGEELIGWAVIK